MRATLLGGVVLVLLVLLGMAVVGHAGREGGFVSGWLGPQDRPPEATVELPVEPPSKHPEPTRAAAAPAAKPSVLTAGELSVLEPEAPEPMVRYVDAEGSIRMVRGLAQVPAPHRANAVVLDRGNVNVVGMPAPTAVAFQDWQPDPNPNRSEVVLFSAPWCGACERAKRHLDQRGVRYEERDIDADDSARQEVLRIVGHIAIPLLEVDGRYLSGFRPDVYDRALGSG